MYTKWDLTIGNSKSNENKSGTPQQRRSHWSSGHSLPRMSRFHREDRGFKPRMGSACIFLWITAAHHALDIFKNGMNSVLRR